MPDQHDTTLSYYFHGNLTSLNHTVVPSRADESMLITLGLGSVCRRRGQSSCKRSGSKEAIIVETMNNISFQKPTAPLLPAHYYHVAGSNRGDLLELPDRPPRVFNFTDPSLIPIGPKEKALETTYMATLARWFRYGSAVEMVFQSTSIMQGDSNPMHLHGHDMFVLAQGVGNYDAERDVAKYNLVNPPVRNSVLVPRIGWAVVRFVADNPGGYYRIIFLSSISVISHINFRFALNFEL